MDDHDKMSVISVFGIFIFLKTLRLKMTLPLNDEFELN